LLLKNKEWNPYIKSIITNSKSSWKDRFPLSDEEAIQKSEEIYLSSNKKVEIKSIEAIKR